MEQTVGAVLYVQQIVQQWGQLFYAGVDCLIFGTMFVEQAPL